jgi:tetratricopeptide (TPR) repeat protein
VFISHTSELQDFPSGGSYVDAVKEAISAAGHVVVDMAGFPAADQPAAQFCADLVRGCEVYVGVLGTRYGSPVRGRPEVSYTELEFDTATEAALDRLVFLLDTDAQVAGIPPSALMDREFGARQDEFRRRVRDSGLVTQTFTSPAELGQLVERSLRELADTRRRISSGIVRERVPAGPQPVRDSKFINPPPAVAPAWFQDRQVQTGLLARYVTDPSVALVAVVGRGGIGKTAMVCRFLKGLEGGRVPDLEGDLAEVTVRGIVYLSRNGLHKVDYPTLVADLLRLLSAETAQRLRDIYEDPHHVPRELILAVLEAFPAGEPVVVLLDNLESVMDAERETLQEQALAEAVSAVLTAPAHAVTVIATTRVAPAALLAVEPSKQRQLPLDKGLGSPDAEIVLRALDDDGRLGLRDAPEELLDGLRRHTRGFPRALEAVKAILDGDRTMTPRNLLDRTRHLPEDQIVRVLVGEAYDLLDQGAQHVMQALAVYPAPVSAVGVDFLLRPVNPTTDAAPVLTRLVRRQLVRFQDGHYYLHPVDRDYARSQLPAGIRSDSPAAFTLTGLKARAADYYAQIRTPRESWRTLDDVRPQLAEFELRCDTGDYDTAATVLSDIDFDYLQLWGHYRMLAELHGRIHGRITEPGLNADHLNSLGLCRLSLGEYRQAIDLFTQALAIFRDIGDRQGEGSVLANLGICYRRLGDYRQAINLYTQALAIFRDIGDRQGEGNALVNLGSCRGSLGDYRQAIDLFTQALAIFRDIGDRSGDGTVLANLGSCRASLGEYRQAIDLFTQALTICRDIGDRQGEGSALGNLGSCRASLGEYRQAIDLFTQALTICRDIGDRQGEGNALAGLGSCRASLGEYRQAIDLFTQALTIFRDIGDRSGEGNALANLGICRLSLGEYRQAIDLHTEAVAICRDIGDRQGEGSALAGLGICRASLGEYRQAIDLFTQALAIFRDIGDRDGEASALDGLGRAWLASGDARQAVILLEQAVNVADTIGGLEAMVTARSGLARAQLQLGDLAEALATAEWRELSYPPEEPTMRLLEGLALLELHHADQAGRAFTDALTAAEELLALADSNVAALQARALALSGMAAVAANPDQAIQAAQAFARLRTTAAGADVTADTRRLFTVIASHDRAGILPQIYAAQER